MDTVSALDALRGKLEATFGKGMAMMILASAANVANVSTIGLSPSEFVRLADAVCADQRVIDMWGAAGAADVAQQWHQLV